MPVKRKKKTNVDTMMISDGPRLEVIKYRQLEDISGDHLDININELLKPPPGLTNDDWLVVNLVDFLERIEMLVSSCSLFCTTDTCPIFNAGPKYLYFWDDDDSPQPVQVSAPEYFNFLKRYIKRNLQNHDLFPPSGQLSERAHQVLKTSYRRLFRILSHLYTCHYSTLTTFNGFNIIEIMNTLLAHYACFALVYQLTTPDQFAPLRAVFTALNRNPSPTFRIPTSLIEDTTYIKTGA